MKNRFGRTGEGDFEFSDSLGHKNADDGKTKAVWNCKIRSEFYQTFAETLCSRFGGDVYPKSVAVSVRKSQQISALFAGDAQLVDS